jgi:photosystem II stability/assembly factor-like uncharacterized protein
MLKPLVVYVTSIVVSALAHAASWNPYEPADGAAAPGAFVAAHPAIANRALIVDAPIEGLGLAASFYTENSGVSWNANARSAAGPAFLSGNPTYAFFLGRGVQRSTDAGRTTSFVPLPVVPPNSAFALGAVNPIDPNELLGYAGDKIYWTVNGGATWAADSAPATIRAMDVDWATRTIYVAFVTGTLLGHRPINTAGAWGVGGQDPQIFSAEHGVVLYQSGAGQLFRSTDGGNAFGPVGQALGPLSICEFAFAASPSTRIYAIECASGRVLRSNDGGASWEVSGTLADAPIKSPAVDAGNPNLLYLVGKHGVWRSTDAGATFAALSRLAGAPGAARHVFFDPTNAQRQWLSKKPGAASVLRSTDGGNNWIEVDATRRLVGVSRSRTNTVFGSLVSQGQDLDFAVSTDGGSTWAPSFALVNQFERLGPVAYGQGANELYVASVGGDSHGLVVRAMRFSDNDGASFVDRFAPPVAIEALAVTMSGPPVVYAGGGPLNVGQPQLFKSTNGAVTWQPVATFQAPLSSFGGTEGNTLTALAIDPTNPNRIFAGFVYPDYVMRSDDAGLTWTRATVGLGAGEITSLKIDPTNASVIYLSQSGSGTFRSTDGGATWRAMDSGLHDELIFGIELNPHAAGRIYAETESGLYAADLGSGPPTANRRAIEFYHRDFNHYFVSADVDEIAGLDAGVFQGWARTGEGIRVAEGSDIGNQPVCRFFGVGFAPLSSHFYTPYPTECEIVKADPKWLYEKIAFGLALPDAVTHGCPPSSRALYRVWNKNENGAPNHRYTTSQFTLGEMLGLGWIFEGEAQTQVFACVPY